MVQIFFEPFLENYEFSEFIYHCQKKVLHQIFFIVFQLSKCMKYNFNTEKKLVYFFTDFKNTLMTKQKIDF